MRKPNFLCLRISQNWNLKFSIRLSVRVAQTVVEHGKIDQITDPSQFQNVLIILVHTVDLKILNT
ncbi:unnamed protein product [Trichobilharzia regenti]|nr:unnamed protein product [Trichobilharzia regenti]